MVTKAKEQMIFTLTVAESKRLIAKATVQKDCVKAALNGGRLILSGGTTNGYILEELLGKEIDKANYTAGIVAGGRQCVTDPDSRIQPHVWENGKLSSRSWLDVLADFGPKDVFIKGANAVDADGNVGILMANPVGGTIGQALGILYARGSHLVVPVGLEKMIPSVKQAAQVTPGIHGYYKRIGQATGFMPLSNVQVITEIEALSILFGVESYAVAAGGCGGSEGAVTLVATGEASKLDKLEVFLKQEIKGEPNLKADKQACKKCNAKCNLPG